MPGTGRVVLPGFPHHIVQRGHNRQVIFAQDEDSVGYLESLRELKLGEDKSVPSFTKGLNMKLVPSLLVLAIAGGVVPSAVAGQYTRHDPVAVLAAATSLVYDKKGETCKEVVGPNTKYEPDNLSNYNVIRPELDAAYSFVKDPMVYDKAEFDSLLNGVQVSVVVPPKHGKVMPVQVTDDKVYKGYFYMAEPGYFGVDKVVFSIKFGNGKTILLNNFVSVVGMPSMGEQTNACPDTPANYQWMREHLPEIKKAWEDLTGGAADDYLPISPLADLFNAVGIDNSALGSAINLSVANLRGCAIGQTVGEGANATITLDTSATGYNWFIDSTPADNSEFPPTSNRAPYGCLPIFVKQAG